MMLELESDVQLVAECRDGTETLRALSTHKPDLLLLDIRMPDLDGFEVLSRMAGKDMPLVVFTTAYDQHAVQAFEAHALDYLLKPFDQERLHETLVRARNELLTRNERDTTQRILHFLSESAAKPGASRRLIIKAGGRVVFLSFDQ